MMIQCNDTACLNTAYTILGGNDFKFEYYKSLNTLKFFTSESLANAISVLTSIGLTLDTDFQIVPNFDYEYPSAYSTTPQ